MDVLAVMDEAASGCRADYECRAVADELDEARSAVAELLAADRVFDLALADLRDAERALNSGYGVGRYGGGKTLPYMHPANVAFRAANIRRAAALAACGAKP